MVSIKFKTKPNTRHKQTLLLFDMHQINFSFFLYFLTYYLVNGVSFRYTQSTVSGQLHNTQVSTPKKILFYCIRKIIIPSLMAFL